MTSPEHKTHSQLPEQTRQSIVAFLLSAYEQRFQVGRELSSFLVKALLTANLGGIGVVVSFGVAMFEKTSSLSSLFWPALLFLLGTISASVAAFVSSVVAINAAEHTALSVENFLKDKMTLGEMKGYSFSARGRGILFTSSVLSVVLWVSAVVAIFITLISS